MLSNSLYLDEVPDDTIRQKSLQTFFHQKIIISGNPLLDFESFSPNTLAVL